MHKLIRAGVATAAIASMLGTSGFAFAQRHQGRGRGHAYGHSRHFTDIGQVPWAQAGIDTMQAQGVLQGVAPGTFDPGGLLTRAQMAAILGRLFGWNQANAAPSVGFDDADSIPAYAMPYVGIASQKGIMRGLPGGRFAPNGHITWAQLAVIVARAYNYPQVPASQVQSLLQQLPYGAQTPGWAAEAVAQDVQAGDFTGLLATAYQPEADVSRAELAQFLTQVEGQGTAAAGVNQNVMTGQVTSVNGLTWTIQTTAGSQTVTVSPSASVFAESAPSTTSAVQIGDSVTLVEAGGQVVVVDITSGPTVTNTGVGTGTGLTGTVESINGSEMVLSLPGIPSLTLAVAPGATVTVNGAVGTLSAIGQNQTVTVELNGSGQVVSISEGTSAGSGAVVTGTVVSFANDVLLLASGGTTSTYSVSPYATVTITGQTNNLTGIVQTSSLAAVVPNETVTLTLSGNQVTAITVLSGLGVASGSLSIVQTSLPAASINVYYSQSLTATGGSGSYTWMYLSGSLPPGMSVGSNGAVAGTPAADGTYTFTVEVRDSTGATATGQYTIVVGATGSGLAVSSTTLPNAALNVYYSQSLTATGGSGSYTWMYLSGSLPPGISVNSNGAVAGTPAADGTYTFTVEVRDSTGATATGQYTIVVGATGSGPTVSTTTLSPATVNVYYAQELAATGGAGSYTWAYLSGSLPPGLSVTTNGVVTGTPTTNGSYTFTVQVRDSAGATATGQFTIVVGATGSGLTIATVSLPQAIQNTAYSQTLVATGGSGSYAWSIISGSLPPGMVLSGAQITGSSSNLGTYTFTVQVRDTTDAALVDSRTLSITVVS